MEIILEDFGTMSIAGSSVDANLEKKFVKSSVCSAKNATSKDTQSNQTKDAYGLAIDIGTTTMVFHLVDLNTLKILCSLGRINPQAPFGGDVIARITACSLPEKLNTLCTVLHSSIREARAELCRCSDINERDITRTTIVGNTTMEHFVAKLNPATIGVAPFLPRSLFGYEIDLAQTDDASQQAYLAPAVTGYVGGDITAGLHVSGMLNASEIQLFIDIGTNGEMALGNRDRIICCATAAGPAFEGAGITFGMPALAGAISSVSVESENLTLQTIGGAPPLGICGSGLIDALACLLEIGLIDETGYLLGHDKANQRYASLIGSEHGQTVYYLDSMHHIYLTQEDIRNIQLAKAAIRAGIDTLLAELAIGYDDIDRVPLAGGFGAHIKPASLASIGLIPSSLVQKIISLGNAAGTGAVAALMPEGRAALENIAAKCEYIELSTNSKFSSFYIEALGFE